VPSGHTVPEPAPVIELVDVTVSFGAKRVLDGLSLKILPGATSVIVGVSGSGKTILLKVMMGLRAPDKGRVMLFGRDVATVSPTELVALRARMSMLFQSYALFDALTVEDNVEFPLRERAAPERDVLELSHALIELLDLEGSEHLLPGALSGGMRKRWSRDPRSCCSTSRRRGSIRSWSKRSTR
jgi:phospholipid/cholesterol/gamma-HCH transport system ATP-binding protein